MDTNPTALFVLVIDDNQDTADSLVDLLTLSGFTARSAYCGEDALKTAAHDLPDVVILDLWMPGMNGWELARQLLNRAKPPILIAITGCGSDEDRNRSKFAGIHIHLVKPVEPALLIEMLKGLARVLASTVELDPDRHRACFHTREVPLCSPPSS
jgi:CheY-like chemotaxis protein